MSRVIKERCEWDNGIRSEWEQSNINTKSLSDKQVTELVRNLNAKSKLEKSVVRYRSFSDDSGDNW